MNDREVIVRQAGPLDAAGFVDSVAALFAEDAGTRDPAVDTGWPREHGAASFESALGDPGRLTLVAQCDGAIVGHLSGLLAEPTAKRPVSTAVLAGLYVRPAHRGDGTGSRLVAEFLNWARERGAEYTEVTAYAANADAVRFYERHGFGALTLTLRQPLG